MPADLLSSLAAYIPQDRVQEILHGSALPADGVALIADVSGFTPLAEALTRGLRADEGAEELTRVLDSVFTPLIRDIHAFRGSVLKFAGDALLVWYGRERRQRRSAVVRRALTSAVRMQESMQRHGQVVTPLGPITLRMKIGLAYGRVRRFKLGLAQHGVEDVLVGATMDRMAEAEAHAQPGEVVLDGPTLVLARDAVQVAMWREGYAVIAGLLRPLAADPWPTLACSPDQVDTLTQELAKYVPAQIEETLVAGLEHVAELRPVVSLFVQFHGLRYDADRTVGDKLQAYFTTAQQIAARHGGRLNRLISGDKGSVLHVIFGAPRAVEAQEQRAVLCALELQDQCGGLPFITMQRIGMARDRVFAGPVGAPERHDYTVMGDAINLSARLMQGAAHGQILMDNGVRQRLGPNFDVASLGQIRVKGKSEPIVVYSAQGFQARQGDVHALDILPLFGREQEMAQLRQRIDVLASGRGNVTVLIGEAGTGKTHLLEVLRAETGVNWVNGICLAYGQTLSGYLALELLRDLVDLPPGAGPDKSSQRLADFCREIFGSDRLASTYPYLARFMGLPLAGEDAWRLDGLAGESLRWQIFQLIQEMLRRLLAERPMLLALDDLQWADPTSLQLIEALLPLADELPLCLVLAMYPNPDSRAWSLRERVLTTERSATEHLVSDHARPVPGIAAEAGSGPLEIVLGPLAREASQALVAFLAPDLPDHLADHLVERSGSNPLFLVELVHTLEVQGLLADPQRLQAMDVQGLDLPDSVQGLLLAQIDRLRVEARRTLQLASVIGKSFLVRVLEAIAAGESTLDQDLAMLQSRGHVREDAPTDLGEAYAFRHQLIQESAYSTLLYQRRRVYHRQVAETLERLFPSLIVEQAGLLGYHYERAHELDRAIAYHGQAGDSARLLYANEEAEALYGRVLALLEEKEAEGGRVDPADEAGYALLDRRARTYLKLAQVRSSRLDFEGAQEYYEQAFDLLDRLTQLQPLEQKDGDTRSIRLGVFHGPTTLDPALAEVLDDCELVDQLFEGLLELDAELNVVPALARRWQVDDGGRRYRFQLREGVRWSDGTSLTAHDFVFAWRRNLDPETGAGLAHQLYFVEGAEAFHRGEHNDPGSVGVRALDDGLLEVQLAQPVGFFPFMLASPITFPQPAHAVRALGSDWSRPGNLVCNGAFVIAGWQQGQEIRLARNPRYHRPTSGNLDDLVLRFVKPRLEGYLADEIDWCRVEDQADLMARNLDHSYLLQYLGTYFLAFSCDRPPFDVALVRQAFAGCIDRAQLVEEVWADVQRPAFGGIVPPGVTGHSPEIGIAFDPEEARSLLAAAGFESGQQFPQVKLAAMPMFGETPRFLRDSWRRHLGVQVDIIEGLDIAAMPDLRAQGEVHMLLLGWEVEVPDPDDALRLLCHGDSPMNRDLFAWRNESFDRLVEQAAFLTDQQVRLALYHQADQVLVAEDAAVVPLYYHQAYGLLRPGYRIEGSGRILRSGWFKYKDVAVV